MAQNKHLGQKLDQSFEITFKEFIFLCSESIMKLKKSTFYVKGYEEIGVTHFSLPYLLAIIPVYPIISPPYPRPDSSCIIKRTLSLIGNNVINRFLSHARLIWFLYWKMKLVPGDVVTYRNRASLELDILMVSECGLQGFVHIIGVANISKCV